MMNTAHGLDTQARTAEPPIFDPRPIHGDASFGRLLGHQRQLQSEHRQSLGMDEDDAHLLPLMLSLARIGARAHLQGGA